MTTSRRARAPRRRLTGRSSALALATGHRSRRRCSPTASASPSARPRDPRLFLTDYTGSGLLGDLTGKTLTATFTITGTATAFTAGDGPPENACGGTPASVRLYFERKFKGPIMNSDQWWSTPQAYFLTSLVGNTLTLTVPLDTANWTDRGFELPSDVPTDFAAAVANVGAVGVSFGGGCFLPTGAFPTDGTASFVLKSYSVS